MGIGLVVAVQLANLLAGESGLTGNFVVAPGLTLAFFAYLISLVLRAVFQDMQRVTSDTICGALSVYLLMGIAWVYLYVMLELAVPGSFNFDGETLLAGSASFQRFLGFSFVTLTTLGYGNIVPLTLRADTLCYAEAVIGQLYVAVLVARLVAMQMSQQTQTRQ